MTKFFYKFKKPCFWPIFGPKVLGAKQFFPENLPLSHTTSYRFLAPCQNLEKTNDAIPRKRLGRHRRMEGRMEDQKDGQPLSYRTLLVTARCPKRRKTICLIKTVFYI